MADGVADTALRVTPLTPTIGATIEGVRLSAAISDRLIAEIRAALLAHKVLFFEDQDLTPVQQRDFARRFGELDIHPLYPGDADAPEIMVLDNHAGNPTDNDHWHTDVTYLERPAMAGILYARELPALRRRHPVGEHDRRLRRAVTDPAGLPRSAVRGARLQPRLSRRRAWRRRTPGANRHESARAEHPPVIHPVVRVHPETGEKALFVNSVFTSRIKGMRREESRALLDFLYAHVQRPDFQVRWRWRPGAVAFWDNRCTQHYAVNDYLPHRRVLTRATVNGDRPVGVKG